MTVSTPFISRLSTLVFFLFCFPLLFCTQPGQAQENQCLAGTQLADRGMKLFADNRKKGLAALIRAHEFCPDEQGITYNLGLAYFQYGSINMALQTWQGLIDQGAAQPQLLNNTAWALRRTGRPEQGLKLADKGLQDTPGDPALLDTAVQCLLDLGRYADAYERLTGASGEKMQKIRNKTGKLMQDQLWREYHQGKEQQALSNAIRLCKRFPNEPLFSQAQQTMLDAMVDDSVKIPLPQQDSLQNRRLGLITAAGDESLDSRIAALTPPATPREGYALIIGLGRYENITAPRYAERDAKNIYQVLKQRGMLPGDSNHVQLLLNKRATNTRIREKVAWLLEKARLHPRAAVYFYFSGHGAPLTGKDNREVTDGLLLPYDTSTRVMNSSTALSVQWLNSRLAKLKNPHTLAMVDACFTGEGRSVSTHKGAVLRLKSSLFNNQKKPLMVAAGQTPAQEFEPGRQGAFTYFLIEALLGDAEDKNQDQLIDAVEAFDHVQKRLADMNMPQDPSLSPRVAVPLARLGNEQN
jgi:tetratricopeptide (TPR) repeat protein